MAHLERQAGMVHLEQLEDLVGGGSVPAGQDWHQDSPRNCSRGMPKNRWAVWTYSRVLCSLAWPSEYLVNSTACARWSMTHEVSGLDPCRSASASTPR